MQTELHLDSGDMGRILSLAKETAYTEFTPDLEKLIRIAFTDTRNLPTILRVKRDKVVIPIATYVPAWTKRYIQGYYNRPSRKVANPSLTYPDSLIKLVFQSRLCGIGPDLLDMLEEGHGMFMSIENLVGELLEEYLALRLRPCGWLCCWGNTLDAIDFCTEDGKFIQVKNSDNSENSSSSRVRNETPILKWARRVSRKPGYYWEELQALVGQKNINEEDFRAFVQEIIKTNPSAVYLNCTILKQYDKL